MKIKIDLAPKSRRERLSDSFRGFWNLISQHAVTICLVVLAVLLVVFVVSAAFLHFFVGVDLPLVEFKHSDTAGHWGQLGDFVGGLLNPLLSFVALMAVVYSINLQRKDLLDVRRESNEANRIQNDQTAIYRRQGVEASLLGLITMHSKMVDETCVKVSKSYLVQGRKAFAALGEEYKSERDRCRPRPSNNSSNVVHDMLAPVRYKEFPLRFYSAYSPSLSRYMRSVFQVMKFIDTRIDAFDYSDGEAASPLVKDFRRFKLSYAARREFSSIFRAQFDQDELRLIFLNCLTGDGGGLKYYVEKYSLLKGMHLELFSEHRELIEQFESSAFQDYEDLDLRAMFDMERYNIREQVRKAFQRSYSKKKK